MGKKSNYIYNNNKEKIGIFYRNVSFTSYDKIDTDFFFCFLFRQFRMVICRKYKEQILYCIPKLTHAYTWLGLVN